MAITEYLSRVKFKRDTSSNWTSYNPILLNGEIILVDTENGELKAKIGDGEKRYTQLPFNDEAIRNLIVQHNVSETAHENMGWITSDDGLPTNPALINADTLGGIAADEYVTISNIPTDLADLNQDSTHRLVSDSEKQTWNSKSDFDGDYNSLTSRPTIPTQLSQLSSDSTHRTVTDTEKSTWNNKMDELSAQTITLTTSGWIQGSDDRYYQTKSVSGVTSSTPVVWVDCDLSTSDTDAKIEILTAWAGPSANEVKQGSGTLTFYSYEKPTVNIPVNVGVG